MLATQRQTPDPPGARGRAAPSAWRHWPALLGVSEMTVRRDIDALDAEGQLLRGPWRVPHVTGGVQRDRTRIWRQVGTGNGGEAGHRRGGAHAAPAGHDPVDFRRHHHLRVCPPAPPGPRADRGDELHHGGQCPGAWPSKPGRDGGIRTLVLGGQRTPSEALVGPVTVHAMENLHADLCFMGVHGIRPRGRHHVAESSGSRGQRRHDCGLGSAGGSRQMPPSTASWAWRESPRWRQSARSSPTPESSPAAPGRRPLTCSGKRSVICVSRRSLPAPNRSALPAPRRPTLFPSPCRPDAAGYRAQRTRRMTHITSTQLADGRELLYFDDAGSARPRSVETTTGPPGPSAAGRTR